MTTIIDFWKKHPQYWLPISPKDKNIADSHISSLFLNYNYLQDNIYGIIIYLDQFCRHFQRFGHPITDENILQNRQTAKTIFFKNYPEIISNASDDIEIVFSLMPLRHLGEYKFILDLVFQYKDLPSRPILSKFTQVTYQKYFTQSNISSNIKLLQSQPPFNPTLICDYFPQTPTSLPPIPPQFSSQLNIQNPIVSLSGGVDSMSILTLLHILKIPTIAIHILYSNREESQQELSFIFHYCQERNIPLYVYEIEYIKRNNINRDFYEEMTRKIRFFAYQSLIEKMPNSKILLGHIKDDLLENIWTNLAKCSHLDNLKKMKKEDCQLNVQLYRPFLDIPKENIYELSKQFHIPYLKNTTPSWCNRGKFRERFYEETHKQYGKEVDKKIIEVAEQLEKQSLMIEKLLYDKILESYVGRRMDVSLAVEVGLDVGGWMVVMERVCHEKLKISRPSIHALKCFVDRLGIMERKGSRRILVQMKYELRVIVEKKERRCYLEFV